jgi:hypothetical protein
MWFVELLPIWKGHWSHFVRWFYTFYTFFGSMFGLFREYAKNSLFWGFVKNSKRWILIFEVSQRTIYLNKASSSHQHHQHWLKTPCVRSWYAKCSKFLTNIKKFINNVHNWGKCGLLFYQLQLFFSPFCSPSFGVKLFYVPERSLYVRYSFLLIFNKFCDFKFTALATGIEMWVGGGAVR